EGTCDRDLRQASDVRLRASACNRRRVLQPRLQCLSVEGRPIAETHSRAELHTEGLVAFAVLPAQCQTRRKSAVRLLDDERVVRPGRVAGLRAASGGRVE